MRDPYIVRRRRTGIETGYLKRITELEGQIKNMQRCGICGNYDQEEGCYRVSDETVNNWETCGIWKMIEDAKG